MADSAHVPTSIPLASWLERLGQSNGAPGDGAASAIMLGLSAALLRMVAGYTHDERAADCARRLSELRMRTLEGSEDDGVRSADLGSALALSDDDPDRDARVRAAALDAAQSAVDVGEVGGPLCDELRLLLEIGNPALAADLAVAAEALAAGLAAASINLRSNIQLAGAHREEGDEADHALRDLGSASTRLSGLQQHVRRIADSLSERFSIE